MPSLKPMGLSKQYLGDTIESSRAKGIGLKVSGSFDSENLSISWTIALGLLMLVIYSLIFMLLFPRAGAGIASLTVVPAIFIGWRMGSRAGLVAGLLSLPLNTFLFNLVGLKGIDVLFRLSGGLGTLIVILLGVAAGRVHDITDELTRQISINKLNEEALRGSEERFRSLFDGVPIGIYRTTPEGKILAANTALLDLLGYREKEPLLSMNVKKLFVDAEDRQRWKSQIEAEGTVRGFQLELRRPDGSTFWVEDNAHIVWDEQGKVAYYEGSLNDITERKRAERAVLESEQRYQGLFERSPVSLWEEDFSAVKVAIEQLKRERVQEFNRYFDEHPEAVAHCLALIRVLDVNYATLNLFRATSKDELLGNLSKVLTASAYDIFRQELIAIAEGQTVFESEGQNCTLAGETIDIYLRWSAAPGHEDTLSKVFVSIVDITERKRNEARLQMQTAQAEALAEISKALSAASLEAQAIFDITVERTTKLIGDACVLSLLSDDNRWRKVAAFHHRDPAAIPLMRESLSSIPKFVGEGTLGEVLRTGEPLFLPNVSKDTIEGMVDPEYEAYLYRSAARSLLVIPLIAQGQAIGTLAVSRHQPGNPYTAEEQAFLQNLANHVALTVMNARLHELVRYQARTDALTRVYNRRHFLSLAELEFSRSERYAKPLSMILLDLDHFKEVNDRYGHGVGDQLLQSVAERCRSNIRPADIIGRYGGEEFTILLPETELAGAHLLAERLRAGIAGCQISVDGESVCATISLGVSSKTGDTPNLTALLRQADEAMYAAKRAGRNQVADF